MSASNHRFLNPVRGRRGMAVAPHALAAQSAVAALRDGANAIEAMIAAAATIAAVYPHMNGLGGDSFWLVSPPDGPAFGIDACGAAAASVSAAEYRAAGHKTIPFRGPLAANTVAGTVSGWDAAYRISREQMGGRLPLARLLEDAVFYARSGIPVTRSQSAATAAKQAELAGIPGFAETYLVDGVAPEPGSLFRQPRLAHTLEQLAYAGLDDFYRGDLAASIAADLRAAGSPVAEADLAAHRALIVEPLALRHSLGTVYNMPPPTQGLVSLLILGQLDRLLVPGMDPLGADFVHACVEATKQAFAIRDRVVTDPAYIKDDVREWLAPARLDTLAARISPSQAQPWGLGKGPADTVWMGVVDRDGCAVSFIQSLYHEFGSGIVLHETGINWQNRGCSFSLDDHALNPLTPGRKPFHTLNPPIARFADGRALVYGNMGGDGQPQSQSAVFSRIARFGMNPQAAIDAPRWLLGRTWGNASDSLKLEDRFEPDVIDALRARGHDVELFPAYDEAMGHAGAILVAADGSLEGGFDPRSDGGVAAW
jgi:gamma-glutamyltranspeptidase